MEYDPMFRLNISEICRDFYKMSKKHLNKSPSNSALSTKIERTEVHDEDGLVYIDPIANLPYTTVKILTVDDAVRIHKSEKNGSKQLAWHSFKYHSSTDLEAKYWLGYYYYHDKEIFELQQINKEKRVKI